MIGILVNIAFSLPGLWARVYTLGLPANERTERLGKITSDTWEQRAAASEEGAGRNSLEALACLAGSVWADLTWRFERGHALRVREIRAGHSRFPVFVTALLGGAGMAGAFRLSAFHDLPTGEHIAITLALLAGPLVGVLGVIVARSSLATGIAALTGGSAALAIAALSTVVAPILAAAGFAVGLFLILETRNASRTFSERGRSAAPTSPLPPLEPLETEMTMETSDRLERWLSLGAILVVVGLAGIFWHYSGFPFEGTDAEIQQWYADGQELRTYGSFFAGLLGAAGLLVFFGGLYASVRRSEGGSGYLSALMLAAIAVAASMAMVATTLSTSTGMAYAFEDRFKAGGVDPQTVRLLGALAYGLNAMAAAALAVGLGVVAIVALRTRQVLPRWLAWATVGVAVLQLLNFPLFNMPYPLFVLWVLVVAGWRLFRSESAPHPMARGAAATA